MKAYELQQLDTESLVVVERSEPCPGPRQVLIKMKAVALNFRDLLLMRGILQPDILLPFTPASDGVGEIVACGEEVSHLKVGDRVAGIFVQDWLSGELEPGMMHSTLGFPRTGMLQEYVVLPEMGVVKVPAHLTDEQAATLPIAGVTAWNALMTKGQVKPGERVLVQGTGGVALFALQFAQLAGAQVIVLSRSAEKLEQVRQLGAAQGINSQETSAWDQCVLNLTDGQGVEHIVDLGGTSTLGRSLHALRPGGQVYLIGNLGGMHVEIDLPLIQKKNAHLQGIQTGSRAMFEAMNQAITLHKFMPVVSQVFPFEEAPRAFQALVQGNTFGKICIRM